MHKGELITIHWAGMLLHKSKCSGSCFMGIYISAGTKDYLQVGCLCNFVEFLGYMGNAFLLNVVEVKGKD